MRARFGTMFESLKVRNYRLYAIGQLIKLIGVWMQFIAQDWLVLELSNNSASALGIVTGLQFAPVLLLTLHAGKLADRHDKRRLLISVNGLFSVFALILGLSVATHLVTLWMVFVLAALMGVVNAVETPVRQAFVSEVVSKELLPNALGLQAATFNTSRIIGPAVAGVAIWLVGMSPVFLINAVLCLAPLIFLARMDTTKLIPTERAASEHSGVRDGLRYIWRREDLVLPLIMMGVIGMFGFNYQVTLAVLAKTVFHTGPQQFGLLSTALAVGALAGALVSGSRRSRPSAYLMLGAAIGFGVLEVLVGFGPTVWVTAALLVPAGFFMIYLAQAANQRIQIGIDPAYRGRVMSVYVFVFLGTTPVGAPLVGFISEHLGPRVGVWGGGLISLAAGIAGLAWQLHRSGSKLRVRIRPHPHVEVIAPAEPAPALVGA